MDGMNIAESIEFSVKTLLDAYIKQMKDEGKGVTELGNAASIATAIAQLSESHKYWQHVAHCKIPQNAYQAHTPWTP